jgi:hypothetical protein
MQSPIRLLALLVLALLATSAVAWKPINKDDAGMCADKSQDAAQAIVAFCQRFPMVSLPFREKLASGMRKSASRQSSREKKKNKKKEPPQLTTSTESPRPRRQNRRLLEEHKDRGSHTG